MAHRFWFVLPLLVGLAVPVLPGSAGRAVAQAKAKAKKAKKKGEAKKKAGSAPDPADGGDPGEGRDPKKPWEGVKGIGGGMAQEALESRGGGKGEEKSTDDVSTREAGALLLATTTAKSRAQLQVDRARLAKQLQANGDDLDARRELAGVNLRLGDLDAALPDFLRVVQARPDDAAARLELGVVLFHRGRPSEAMSHFLKATDLQPKMLHAWMNLGLAYLRLGLPARAVYAYGEAVKLAPDSVDAIANLGESHAQSMDREKGEKYLRQAIAKDASSIPPLVNLGKLLIGGGDIDKALETFDKALQLAKGKDAELHYNRGVCLFRLTRYKDATDAYKQAIKQQKKFPRAYNNLGVTLGRLGRVAEMQDAFRAALKQDPRYTLAMYNLGVVSFELGHTDEAIRLMNDVVIATPSMADAHRILGESWLRKRNFRKAKWELVKALELKPGDTHARRVMGILLAEQGDSKRAIAELEAAVRENPKDVQARVVLGRLHAMGGNAAKATELYEAALKLDPKSAEAHFHLGEILYAQGKRQAAMTHYEAAVAADSRHAGAQFRLGEAHHARGELAKAVAAYRAAMASDPAVAAEAHYKVGNVFFQQSKTQLEIAEYQQALKLNPKHLRAKIALGFAYARLRMFAKALEQLDGAIVLDPESEIAHHYRGAALYNAKRVDDALAAYLKAAALRPGFAEAHFNAGQIWAEKGNKAKAIEHYRKAIAANPKYDAAIAALSKLQGQ